MAALGLVVSVAVWRSGSSAVANDASLLAVGSHVAVALVAGDDSKYEYVGSKKCKMCHVKLYKSWAKTKMGKAFDILKPGHSKEAKEKFNIDVDKDYTSDATCLKCHTVGYDEPGGYQTPDPEDKKAVRKAKALQGVGCESCHGPGSAYIDVFKDILMSKRKYKVEELYAVGLRKVDESGCITCHNDRSPTVDTAVPFDFSKRKDEDMHEPELLKQREK